MTATTLQDPAQGSAQEDPAPLNAENPVQEPLIGLTRAWLAERLGDLGVPERQRRMRVSQLWSWIYVRGATGFEVMTDIAKELRGEFAAHFTLARPEIVTEQVSMDGTRKWLLRLDDGKEVETVYIPEEDRGTLCISSQVGCTLNCTFCHTGTQRLVRNLTPNEIVGQIMLARDRIGDWPGAVAEDPTGLPSSERKITNVVLMGMGEPLYNFEHVRDACAIAADGEGLSVSKRRITLSTSGIVPEIARWGARNLRHDAGGRQRDAALGHREAFAIGGNGAGVAHVLEIVERLAHAHEHDIGDLAFAAGKPRRVFGDGARPIADTVAGQHDLSDDLVRREIAHEPLRAGVAAVSYT